MTRPADPFKRFGVTEWMIDCEFVEDGHERPIELISIALVSAQGREYYAANCTAHPSVLPNIRDRCGPWVRSHVLPHLPSPESAEWRTRTQIKDDILALIAESGDRPEFWGYYADYDYVLFAQLFGKLIDRPVDWPMFCLDLKQHMEEYRVSVRDMPDDPPGFVEHHALHDARKQMAWLNHVNRFHRRYM